MSLRSPRPLALPAALLALLVSVASIASSPAEARAGSKSGSLLEWTVTEGDRAVGTEKLRLVRSESGSLFASGELTIKRGKHKAHRKTHLQRDAEGKLMKYRRVEVGRKGKGVFAFNRKGGLRVVGVNTGKKASDHGDLLGRYVWDPEVWSHLAVLASRLDAGEQTVKISFFNIATKEPGTATLSRQAKVRVLDEGGHEVEVRRWALQSGPGAPLTLFVAEGGRLIGVKGEARRMLLKGWSWAPSAPAPAVDEPAPDKEIEAPAAKGEAPAAEGVGP